MKIKVRDIEGLLPEKKDWGKYQVGWPVGWNEATDVIGEKLLEIKPCDECRGITRFEGDNFVCRTCRNDGFIVRCL